MRGVRDLTALDRPSREAWVTAILAEPHEGTVEDFQFAEEVLDNSPQQLIALFLDAAKLLMIEHPHRDDVPLYMVAVDAEGYIHTLLHVDLDQHQIYMTKALIRFTRIAAGQRFCEGALGWAETGDISAGYFRVEWAKRLGFQPIDQHDMAGYTFQRFQYHGA